jgi:hypothetical protein
MTSSLRVRDIDLAPEGLQTHNLKEGFLQKKVNPRDVTWHCVSSVVPMVGIHGDDVTCYWL